MLWSAMRAIPTILNVSLLTFIVGMLQDTSLLLMKFLIITRLFRSIYSAEGTDSLMDGNEIFFSLYQ